MYMYTRWHNSRFYMNAVSVPKSPCSYSLYTNPSRDSDAACTELASEIYAARHCLLYGQLKEAIESDTQLHCLSTFAQ